MKLAGNVWKYGDDVNTDVLFPGKYTYLTLSDEETASHALEGLDPRFAQEMAAGDIPVGGWNWGVGSAREQAVKALKFKGVRAILAKSFARIYFRNCINEGVLAIACPAAVDAVLAGERVEIDTGAAVITTARGAFPFERYPDYVLGLVEAGGIIPYTKRLLEQRAEEHEAHG